jgi:N,N'-diacetyllegionaminate synthase
MKKKVYIIAEVGPNHQGSVKLAIKYIRVLSKIGVDAVKFQIGIASEHYSQDSFKANYQKRNFKNKDNIIKQANKRLLRFNDHIKLYKEARKCKIDYICSAFDLKSLVFLTKKTKFPYYKIPSGEIKSLDVLNYLSQKKKPIILSTGMSNLDEIKTVINILNKNFKKKIILMHCVSDYPAKDKDLNLNFITNLKNLFNYPVGLSDHSTGFLAPLIAVSLGAVVIEKHVTFNHNLKGPDHKASATIKELSYLVKMIRKTEICLGKGKKILSKEEINNAKAVRKSCIAKKTINIGERIKKNDICFKRPGTGISPLDFKKIINKKARKVIIKDRIFKLTDFE